MQASNRLTLLRFGLSQTFVQSAKANGHATPGLHHLLPVPIRERLILLAKLDGAEPATIRKILRVSQEDALLQSVEMQLAIHIWQRSMNNTYWYLPTKHGWRQQRNTAVERALGQLLWADVAVALIGDSVPSKLSAIPLRRRLILYMLLVEQYEWSQIMEVMSVTNWEIRQAINTGLTAIGGE